MKRQLTIPETYKRAKRIKDVRSVEKTFKRLNVKEFKSNQIKLNKITKSKL